MTEKSSLNFCSFILYKYTSKYSTSIIFSSSQHTMQWIGWGCGHTSQYLHYFWFCAQESILVDSEDHTKCWESNPDWQCARQVPYSPNCCYSTNVQWTFTKIIYELEILKYFLLPKQKFFRWLWKKFLSF